MTRQEAIECLELIKSGEDTYNFHVEAINMAIYALGTIDELKKERDAALDMAFAALKMKQERTELSCEG